MDEYLGHSSVDASSGTHVHPWDVIRNRLGQELDSDGDLFKRMIEAEIGTQICASIKDAQTYFDYLETHYAKGDMLDYLIYLLEHVITLYIDLGTLNVVGLLKGYKTDLENLQRKLERDGMLKDTKFVGREQYMTDIKKTLTENSNVKGVCICGLGGLGKTSLAKEVCRSLGNTWTIHIIDLREKTNLKDLIRSTLDSYLQPSHGDSITDLQHQLFNFLQTQTNKKDILLFDNMDDMVRHGRETRDFIHVLLQTFHQMASACKIRVIITSRHKFDEDYKLKTKMSRFGGLMEEIELTPLKQEDALRLFDLCTEGVDISASLSNQIVELCGRSPLAIRTLCSTLKDRKVKAKQLIANLKSSKTSDDIPEIAGIFNCLQETFDGINPFLQKQLIQLSIFHASPFDIHAAAKVLGEVGIETDKPIVMNTLLKMLHLKSHHLVEIEKIRYSSSDDDETVINPIGTSTSRIEYSLHPLVSAFLQKKARVQPFSRDIDIARRRFVSHFKVVVNKFGELEEKNYWKALSIMEKNKVHLLHFFQLLQSVPESENKHEIGIKCYKSSHTDILTSKRIADIVALMVDDYERLEFTRKAYTSAMRRQDTLCAILWKVQEGTLLYEMDRRHLVLDVINEIEVLLTKVEGYEENAMAAVCGHYYYLKGRYQVEIRDFPAAVQSLQSAEKFYYNISCVKYYKSSLARVYNAMGNIYFRRPPINLEKAKLCYEKALQLVLSKTDNEYKNLDIPVYLTNVGSCLFREGVQLEEQNKDPNEKYKDSLECFKIAIKCDLQMKMRESEDYAHKLSRMADVLARLGHFDHAVSDIKESVRLRRKLLAPPHAFITITTHKVGDILKQKALSMYNKGELAYKIINVIYEARMYYQETLDLIKDGGLPKDHPEYSKIKKNHIWLERQVEEPDEMRKIKSSYKRFEQGQYDDRAAARQSMEATIVDHMSREQKMKLLTSSDERRNLIQNVGWRKESDSTEDASYFGENDQDEGECLHLMAKMKLQAAQLSSDRSSSNSPAEKETDEVFVSGATDISRRHINLDDDDLLSFLESYVPSNSEEFGDDFWYLIAESKEPDVIGNKSNQNQKTNRKRSSADEIKAKKEKR